MIQLEKTAVEKRGVDLKIFLDEIFVWASNGNFSFLRQLENLLRNHKDRSALKVELAEFGCLESIGILLEKFIDEPEKIVEIFSFLIEFVLESEKIRQKFVELDIYRRFFSKLEVLHSAPVEFVEKLVFLLSDRRRISDGEKICAAEVLTRFVNPNLAEPLVRWIPNLRDAELRRRLIESIQILVSTSFENKILSVQSRIVELLLNLLIDEKMLKIVDDKILFDGIFSIFEKIFRFSIEQKEIREIFQVFIREKFYRKRILRVLLTAAKHDDSQTSLISSYFDLQHSNSGIFLPSIRRWPSVSSSCHLTFHCWIRLENEFGMNSGDVRRQIYVFHSDSFRLESFVLRSSIIVTIVDRRDFSSVELKDLDEFTDGHWHSLTIVHTGQRPSIFVAAFQSVSNCFLSIYIDGILRKQIKDFKFVPLSNETINEISIGSPTSRETSRNEDSNLSSFSKTFQPLKGFFSSRKEKFSQQNSSNNEINEREKLFGPSVSLHGQFASIWLLAESLNENQIKTLHLMGPDFCQKIENSFQDEISSSLFELLSNRTVGLYHPLASNDRLALDISTQNSQLNGRLNNVSSFRVRSFAESFFNIGDCSILYRLFEYFTDEDYVQTSIDENFSSFESNLTDWIVVRNQSQSIQNEFDQRFPTNPISLIINLIRFLLTSKFVKRFYEQISNYFHIDLLSFHLNRIPTVFIDKNLLISIEQLVETTRFNQILNVLHNEIIQHVVFDFSIWVKGKFSVKIAHLQYLSALIKDEKNFYRNKFGVQFFLDVLRQFFNSNDEPVDEQKQLRAAVYGVLKFYLQKNPRLDEINAFLSTISSLSTSNDLVTRELLEFIYNLLDPPSISTDTTIGLLCEPSMIENLYTLLTIRTLSIETKEIFMKIIKNLVNSKRVPQQVRSQLRLETTNLGFGGIVNGLTSDEVNVNLIRDFFNLIVHSDSTVSVDHLNVILTLCSGASFDVRYVAMRKLMTCFIANQNICRSFSKSNGWQETLSQFFVKSRRNISNQTTVDQSALLNVSSDGFLNSIKDQSEDSGRGSSRATSIHQNPTSSIVPPRVFETSSSPDDPTQQRIVRPLDLSPIIDEIPEENSSRRFSSPRPSICSNSISVTNSIFVDPKDATPEFLQRNSDVFQQELTTPPRSSSNSREDLLSLTKTESTGKIDRLDESSLFIPSFSNRDDGSLLDELGETLILTLVMIIWKGISAYDNESWILRGQLFSALHNLDRDFHLILPLSHIERRILELSIETCLNELKINGGKTTISYESNCREMIKLIDDFLSRSNENIDRMSEDFVQGIISLLDSMLIFEENGNNDPTTSSLVSHDEHWTESSLSGLNILLKLLEHSNPNFCGLASVRVHSLLHSRPISGREEAAFLLSSLNRICSSFEDSLETEHFAYLLPLMKTIIDKSYNILQMNVQIPNVPLHKATATAWDDFRQYSSSSNGQEWKNFIQRHIEPLAENYRSMSIRPFQMNMKIWWNTCHEMMMIGVHKRNRQIGEEKLIFQSSIVDQWRNRRRSDHQRLIKLAKQRRIHKMNIEQKWKNCQRYFLNERGPCFESSENSRHWILSNRENIYRMRCKLIENDEFDEHQSASRSRDNLGVESIDRTRQTLLEQSLQYKSILIQSDNIKSNSLDEQQINDEIDESQSLLLEGQEKIIVGTQCSLISFTSTIEGKLEITNKFIYFFDSSSQKSYENDFKYPLSWLQDVQIRRYNLRPSAIEFFLLNKTNFLINFDKKLRRQIYQKILSLKLPSMKRFVSNQSINMNPIEILKESKLTEKWSMREISNFDYLMMLNTIAGRTYNDLNQYPIFPWILKDYTSNVLNLNDPNVYRDFSRPISIQNSKHIEDVRLKYESFDDPSGLMKKFHYGTHYSNAANVMHYLIRMEPFTTFHIQLQSGKFDIADRQFHSFQSTWSNILDSPNDGKELIPEFFYLPEFLENSNKFDLGQLQITQQIVDDVQLPPWANGSAEEFIRLHRLALESDYVSSNLHHWIDLIFGYKQTGQAAVDALNVYMHCSYENAVDLDTIEDPITREAIEGMIQNFGQIPSQLLTEAHPQRLTRQQVDLQNESLGRQLNMLEHLTHIRAFFVEITPADEKLCDPITFISIPKNQIRSFMQQGIPDTLITVSINGVVGNNGWQPYDKSLSNFFTFERDPTLQTERNRHIIAAPFSPSIKITSRLFAVSHDAKYVFSGGHWDWSLRIYSLLKSKIISSIIYHNDVITCLALDSTGNILVTGSKDTTCVIWHLTNSDNRSTPVINEQESNSFVRPKWTLYGHDDQVTCLAVSIELDLVVSGSLDGTCNIHTVENGIYIRSLKPINGHPLVNLKLSNERHILIQTEKDETNLFLYSINGRLIRSKKIDFPIVDLLLADHHIVLAVNHLNPNERGQNAVGARVIIKEMFEMKTVQTIRLRAQINCLYFTRDFSHLLVGVKDGKLIVLTAEKKSSSKSSVKNST